MSKVSGVTKTSLPLKHIQSLSFGESVNLNEELQFISRLWPSHEGSDFTKIILWPPVFYKVLSFGVQLRCRTFTVGLVRLYLQYLW